MDIFVFLSHRAQALLIAKSTGCKGSYSLMRLSGHDRLMQCVPDAMHTVKDVIEKLIYLIIGKMNVIPITMYVLHLPYILAKSGDKPMKAEAALGRFGLEISTDPTSLPWELTPDKLQLAVRRLKDIQLPRHLDCNPSALFTHPSRLKSHDWKQVSIIIAHLL